MAHTLFIDIESRGRPRLADVGAFVYAEHPETTVLGIGMMLDAPPIYVVVAHRGEQLPAAVQDALADPATRIVSWGDFDRVLLQWAGLGEPLGWPQQTAARWVNAMDIARASNLPAALDAAALALGLTAGPDAQKDKRGKALVKKFTVPQKTGQFLDLADYPDDARAFLDEYMTTDVLLMVRLVAAMAPLSTHEVLAAEATWRMNVTGVGVDAGLANALLRFRAWLIDTAQAAAQERHAINLRSTPQVRQAFIDYGVTLPRGANGKPTTNKELLRRVLSQTAPTAAATDLFELRRLASGTSLAKAEAALAHRCDDGRARGLFVYSAARTGRWTSRGLQLQNLPRPRVKLVPRDVETLVTLLTICADPAAAATLLELLFAAPAADLAVSALRSLVIPASGNVLVVGDFKMVEVVTNWSAAGEVGGLASLAAGNEKYLAFARDLLARVDMLLNVVSEEQRVALLVAREIIARSLRDIGKTGLLSIQYGTSAHGLARQSNIPIPLAALMIENYDARYPAVAQHQRHLVEAAITALREAGSWRLPPLDLRFRRRAPAADTTLDYLEMVRPSGEAVRYLAPEVVNRQRGNVVEHVVYHSAVKGSVLLRQELRLSEQAEHCASSIARDALADALVRADAAGWPVVMAVHDELVVETPACTANAALQDLLALMATKPAWWDPSAPLAAEGAVIPRYQKI